MHFVMIFNVMVVISDIKKNHQCFLCFYFKRKFGINAQSWHQHSDVKKVRLSRVCLIKAKISEFLPLAPPSGNIKNARSF